ncbi:hypothetical protein [Sphingobium phenoxybenzoativorans]|uniref:hypothetical protein n=1 Tax=Sphingobium phenoxybenzoativorans TaxID=1592790 RepID=UPI000871C216|nr:hypothetical protein [Sphingobium phenoxybenzoativorans]
MDFDFSMARTPNFVSAALSGYQVGQKLGQQKRVRAALSQFGTDPQGAIDEAVAAGDIDTANALQKRYDDGAVRAALPYLYNRPGATKPALTLADVTGNSQTGAPLLHGGQPALSRIDGPTRVGVLNPPPPGGGDEGNGEGPDIVVTARPKAEEPGMGELNHEALVKIMTHDPKLAIGLIRMDGQQRAQTAKIAQQQVQMESQLINAVRKYPEEERDGVYQELRADLEAKGVKGLPEVWDEEFAEGRARLGLTVLQAFNVDRADRRLAADIEDDEADNARADRNTASIIADRDGRRGLIARGQDIASRDRRRGQDISSTRPKGGKGAGTAPVIHDVKTPAEARALPKGAYFRIPGGGVKVNK